VISSNDSLLSGNTLEYNRFGAGAYNSTNATLANNTIRFNSRAGVAAFLSSAVITDDNNINNNTDWGVLLIDSRNVSINETVVGANDLAKVAWAWLLGVHTIDANGSDVANASVNVADAFGNVGGYNMTMWSDPLSLGVTAPVDYELDNNISTNDTGWAYPYFVIENQTENNDSATILTPHFVSANRSWVGSNETTITANQSNNVTFVLAPRLNASIAPSTNIIANDSIQANWSINLGGPLITENATYRLFVAGLEAEIINITLAGNLTLASFRAPAAPDALCHPLVVETNYTSPNNDTFLFNVSGPSLCYRDITPPNITGLLHPVMVLTGTGAYMEVNATDNAQVENVSVTLAGTTYYLSTTDNFTWNATLPPQPRGDYNVTYTLNDTTGNVRSTTGAVIVYVPVLFMGTLRDAEANPLAAGITVYSANTLQLLANFSSNASTGYYSEVVPSPNYVTLAVDTLNATLTFRNVSLTTDVVDPLRFDAIPVTFVGLGGVRLRALSVELLAGLSSSNISLVLNYSGASYQSEANIGLYRCGDWSFANRSCSAVWQRLDGVSVNPFTKIISANLTALSGYAAAEFICGNGVCEGSRGESSSNCPQDCPVPTVVQRAGGGVTVAPSGGVTPEEFASFASNITSMLTRPPEAEDTARIIEEIGRLQESLGNATLAQAGLLALLNRTISLQMQIQSLFFELYPGEKTIGVVPVRNALSEPRLVRVSATGEVARFLLFEKTRVQLGPGEEANLLFTVRTPQDASAGIYSGGVILQTEETTVGIPASVRVLELKERQLVWTFQPLTDRIGPGETLKIDITMTSSFDKVFLRDLILRFINPTTEEVYAERTLELMGDTPAHIVGQLKMPSDIPAGRYSVRGVVRYTAEANRSREAVYTVPIIVEVNPLMVTIAGVPVWAILAMLLATGGGSAYYVRQKMEAARRKRYLEMIDFTKLPAPGERSAFIGKIAETEVRAFMDLDKLTVHTLVAGATGSGKTVAAQVIVEEALKRGIAVIVFDPTKQWTGFLRSNKNKEMLALYRKFGMKLEEARAFNGNIHHVTSGDMLIDIKKYMNPGEITIFTVAGMSTDELEKFYAGTIRQVFAAQLEESQRLRLLIVYDEVHRILPKFGARGEGILELERGAREFRKWGVGLVLVSQVLSDVVGEIKANIGTEIQMRTKYEGDLERMKLKYGEDTMRSIARATVGTGMIQNPEYNNGRPYFAAFRPLQHSVVRLSDKELETYEKYNVQLEMLAARVEALKQKKVDVFDVELEVGLARNKLKQGAFNVVDIYMESLNKRIEKLEKEHLYGVAASKG
ncbi:MAG: helicase HerA-like domain-containing protein, partial [Candidatus Micrarchaeia archaeon]